MKNHRILDITLREICRAALTDDSRLPSRSTYRDHHKYLHDWTRYRLPDAFGCRVDSPTDDQEEIVCRLIDYFHRIKQEAKERGLQKGEDMWKTLTEGHATFEAMLENRDVTAGSAMLLNVCNTALVAGFENTIHSQLPAHVRFLSLNAVDKYLALGEALGSVPVQCPEQGNFGYAMLHLDEIHEQIQSRLPFDITPPKAGGGSFGLRTRHGVLTERNIQAIHAACLAYHLMAESKAKVVCEIGGGIGALTYYLARAGMDEVSLYDLPSVSVVQGYYLLKSLGTDMVWLHGEPVRSAKVRVLPYWILDEAPESYFSLMINQDSLPEIDRKAALHYIKLILEKGNQYFLSVNQEAGSENLSGHQSVVFDLVEEAGGLRRFRRSRNWTREGYVEEVYLIEGR